MKNEPEWYKSGWHKAYVQRYSKEQPSYKVLAENLEEVLWKPL